MDSHLHDLLEKATLALGRFDGMTLVLPDPGVFLYSYVRKEAVLSSQIEGTQSTLSDLLLFENEAAPGVPLDDLRETSNYVSALQHAAARLREGIPISLRLLKEVHAILLSSGRGIEKEPGEFRRSQNWFGGSRPGNAVFVPPPPDYLMDCLGALEKFLHDDPVKTPLLIKAALAHAQFETIHPFWTAKNRTPSRVFARLRGRRDSGADALSEPVFEEKPKPILRPFAKSPLFGRLGRMGRILLTRSARNCRGSGLDGTAYDKRGSSGRAENQKAWSPGGVGYACSCILQRQPLASIAATSKFSNLSFPAVNSALKNLQQLGLVAEVTGQKERSNLRLSGILPDSERGDRAALRQAERSQGRSLEILCALGVLCG